MMSIALVKHYLSYAGGTSTPFHAFLESLFTSSPSSIRSMPLATFPHNNLRNNRLSAKIMLLLQERKRALQGKTKDMQTAYIIYTSR